MHKFDVFVNKVIRIIKKKSFVIKLSKLVISPLTTQNFEITFYKEVAMKFAQTVGNLSCAH